MACSHGCEVPCWSGVWFETSEEGYLEISDLDERLHRPPKGWGLVTVDVNVINSSQIFRYAPILVASAPLPLETLSGLL